MVFKFEVNDKVKISGQGIYHGMNGVVKDRKVEQILPGVEANSYLVYGDKIRGSKKRDGSRWVYEKNLRFPHEELEVVPKVKKQNIIYDSNVDDYLGRNSSTIVKALEQDKEKLTSEDLNLLLSYENNNKARVKITEKLKELKEVQ